MQPYPYPDDPGIALCPLQAFRDDPRLETRCFVLHEHWTKGIMPEPGGVEDQAAHFEFAVISTHTGITVGQTMLQEIAQRKADLKSRQKNRK